MQAFKNCGKLHVLGFSYVTIIYLFVFFTQYSIFKRKKPTKYSNIQYGSSFVNLGSLVQIAALDLAGS